MSVSNVKVKPQYVYFGESQFQVEEIICVADVSSSLNNKYFVFHDSAGAKHYAWFDVGSAGADPAPAGSWTAHEVNISANATASAVASALQAVLTAVTGFDASVDDYTVTLTHTADGYSQPARDINTGFAFEVVTWGMEEEEVGCLDGDIEISGFTQQKLEITCHHSGSTVLDERITGYDKLEVALVLKETSKDKIKGVLTKLGMGSFTPVGSDKDEVFGYGPANVGSANPKFLVRFHAVGTDASNKAEDWNFWKCELQLDTLNFSGENVSTIPATLTVYPDDTKPVGIQFFMIGDAAKAGY
jgi:hypothetical protein